MARALKPIYDEVVTMPAGDRIPRGVDIAAAKLSRTLQVRLDLEHRLRLMCGNPPAGKSTKLSTIQVQVLLTMLAEADSPLSANVRATAATILGAAGIADAAPQLRAMALDDAEGPQTRLNAAVSFIQLGRRVQSADVTRLLESDSPVLRAAACAAALDSANERLIALAQSWYDNLDDDEVRAHVQQRVPRLRDSRRTSEDR